MTRTAQARVQKQRERILLAAQECFIRDGFHAASMASIAQAADMSAGLIYRYFDSKRSIVLAIIERQLEERRAGIAKMAEGPDLAQRCKELFASWRRADPSVRNAALFLEMSAEASRDAAVAEALLHFDQVSSGDFRDWLRQHAATQGAKPCERTLQVRNLALQAFIEGLAIRAVREPDFDETVLGETIDAIVPRLLDFRGVTPP